MRSARPPAAVSVKPFLTHRIELRGLDSRILTWGEPSSPKLVLLHGWMDVAASFQFVVDALAHSWFVIAPNLRGYGGTAWQPQGYWYADYVADLEALLDVFAPGEPVNLVGHSLGGNVVLHYAGVRPARVRAVVSLEGFGIAAETPEQAPAKLARWLDALLEPATFASYASFDAVADRLQKNDPHLVRERALYVASHWAEERDDGRVYLTADPRHKLPFPTVYRIEETFAIWARIAAPTLWVVAAQSHVPRWLEGDAASDASSDGFAGVRRRLAHIRDGRIRVIADAGHMLHHDQPEAVASAMEEFLPR